MPTVVIRLWEPTYDDDEEGVLRGVVEIVGTNQTLPFVGEAALLEILNHVRSRRAADL